KHEAQALANLVATAIVVIVGALCVLGVIFSPVLVSMLASGFKDTPGKFELTVQLTRIMFPFLLLVALSAQVMGILNACNQFGVPATASTFFNIGSLFFGLLLGRWLGPVLGISDIHGMAYGVVLGGALQLGWQLPSLYRAGFRFRPQFDWKDPGLRRILYMMGPAILGNSAVQVNVAVNSNFASWLGDGPVSWLQAAFRFMQLPLGIFGVAIASATLPTISRSAARQDYDEFRLTLSRSLGLVFLLTIPSAVALVVLAEPVVAAIYQHGLFTAADTRQTARALAFYAIGLTGYAAVKVLSPCFYALNDSRTPMLVSLFSMGVNVVGVLIMLYAFGLGHEGLAMSTSLVAIFNGLTLFVLMRNRIGGIHGRGLWRSFVLVCIAAAVMGMAVWGTSYLVQQWLGQGKAARLVDLVISIPTGLVILFGTCRLLRVPELDMALKASARPLGKLFPFLRARI
ncbi:MAG TPA: murein biosynthesis integral membrane protein MurJ, partial [Bryobacteraceae bacterium]|nr:murein biosynthesis integral membrane protein MurJ [Bryobacteraceae bacterium]